MKPNTIPALTIQQPWAWAITAGHKPVENRSWTTGHRGPIVIHAGKTWDHNGEDAFLTLLALVNVLPPKWYREPGTLPRGAVVSLAELVDVCAATVNTTRRAPIGEARCECGIWAFPGAYHWRLNNIRPLPEPVETRGHLGLWDLDTALLPTDALRQVSP